MVDNTNDIVNGDCNAPGSCTFRKALLVCYQDFPHQSCTVDMPGNSNIQIDGRLGPIYLRNLTTILSIMGRGSSISPTVPGSFGGFLEIEGTQGTLTIQDLEISGFWAGENVLWIHQMQGSGQFSRLRFADNKVNDGAIFAISDSPNANVSIQSSMFEDNIMSVALYVDTAASVYLSHSVFTRNTHGGFAVENCLGDVHLFESNFTSNSNDYGGAVWIIGPVDSSVSITDCTFYNNRAVNDGGAVAIGNVTATGEVTGCTFDGNTCGGSGGAVAFLDIGPCDVIEAINNRLVIDDDGPNSYYGYEEGYYEGYPAPPRDLAVPTKTRQRQTLPVRSEDTTANTARSKAHTTPVPNAPSSHRTLTDSKAGLSMCPPYTAGNFGAVPCQVEVCAGYDYLFSMCHDSSTCDMDTYLDLRDSEGNRVRRNDDSCSLCSEISISIPTYPSLFQVRSAECEMWTLMQKCYSSSSCGGQVVVEVTATPVTTVDILHQSIISNSVFRDNHAAQNSSFSYRDSYYFASAGPGHGGAVSLGCGGSYALTQNSFSSNSALRGGAVAVPSTVTGLSISTCDFEENDAMEDGGGLFIGAFITQVVVEGCSFVDNHAHGQGGGGGVLLWFGCEYVNISTSEFRRNTAYSGGGLQVFNVNDYVTVERCLFDRNVAVEQYENCVNHTYYFPNNDVWENRTEESCTSMGGGMSVFYYNMNFLVKDCSFTGNVATYGGGIGFDILNVPLVIDSEFIANVGIVGGGGLYFKESGEHAEVARCLFDGNRNTDNDGGGAALHGNGVVTELMIYECVFRNNTSVVYAAALYFDDYVNTLTVSNCVFSGNSGRGKAPVIEFHIDTYEVFISDSVFSDNRGVSEPGDDDGWMNTGGVISFYETCEILVVSNCSFTDNEPHGTAGAIYNPMAQNVNIRDSTFQRNHGMLVGAVYAEVDVEVSMSDCSFDSNMATDEHAEAGAVHFGTSGVSLVNCTFTENSASNHVTDSFPSAGALLSRGTVEMEGCVFRGNRGASGSVYHTGESKNLEIFSSVFADNVAVDSNSSGGAVHHVATGPNTGSLLTVQACTFERNSASTAGGAIFSDSQFFITESVFDSNSAGSAGGLGGAVHLTDPSDAAPNLTSNTFRGNTACDAGAVYIQRAKYLPSSYTDNEFLGNLALCGVNDDMYHVSVSTTISSCECALSFQSYAVVNNDIASDTMVLSVSVGEYTAVHI